MTTNNAIRTADQPKVCIIGAGLAGCEAAWQCANMGVPVVLYEMKPKKFSPAHHYKGFAELVCSNSLKSNQIENACGLLKEEMRRIGSIIIKSADETAVPAGGALAVDREAFSDVITQKVTAHPLIDVVHEEVTNISGIVGNHGGRLIIASGPLTDGALFDEILKITSIEYLHFFDAAAPLIETESINMDIAFKASRYGKDEDKQLQPGDGVNKADSGDYINCPMNREQYFNFYNELINAELADVKDFDGKNVFEGCMPVEVMAKRGVDTLRFGPLKPVGLNHPVTGAEYYAVVQLRQDDHAAALYNMVGFQTRLKFGEQKRVFSMIPGLENAVFTRYGVMHRNTFINSPRILDPVYRMRENKNIYFAGQITGVEGYVESASSGMVAGINAALDVLGNENIIFSDETAIGALASYVSNKSIKNFQPMNANFGIIKPLTQRIKDKKQRYRTVAGKAIGIIDEIALKLGELKKKQLKKKT